MTTSGRCTATGAPIATSCGRSADEFDAPTGRRRPPARRSRGAGRPRLGAVRGRGRDPVRRRHERRRRRRAATSATTTRARSRSTCGHSTACSRSTRSRWPRGSRPARPGPRLEAQLAEHGLTLRHFPQSFQFSTLGGWIATRAGGHFATLYTHIDDLVESDARDHARGRLGVASAAGLGRRRLAGPDADRLRGHARR